VKTGDVSVFVVALRFLKSCTFLRNKSIKTENLVL
jgi:hypothetical protein